MSDLRGHAIYSEKGEWFYSDTKAPIINGGRTSCGHCGRERTTEGHDGCIGTLPETEVMNACCGHGHDDEAYIQFWNGGRISGKQAIGMIRKLAQPKEEG
jgi:hypothetical protein